MDEMFAIYSALSIPVKHWKESFDAVKEFRRNLKRTDGILMRKELHATDFVADRGSLGAPAPVFKSRRAEIFHDALKLVASLPGIKITNICLPRNRDNVAFEYLLNRIHRSAEAWNSHALVISDKGKEIEYTRLSRRLRVFNPIRSSRGTWDDGNPRKNIPLDRLIDDIVFKDSESSYFVQMADLCAYALLRRENPVASKSKYGIDQAFNILKPVLNTSASAKDPEGIVRS